MAQFEVLMAGTGGQGLIFVASFLAEAGILAGNNAVQTQTYGIAQRGGFVSAEVLLDAGEILFQQVTKPGVILALHDVVGTRYDNLDVPIVYDSSIMHTRDKTNWYGIPCQQIATDLRVPRAANLVALGAAMALYPALSFDDLCQQAFKKMKEDVANLNIEAMRQGMELALKSQGK